MIVFSEKDGDIGNFTVEISNEALKDAIYRYFDVNDVFPDDDIIRYVKKNYKLEDIFDEDELTDWVEQNGYVKD